MARNKNDKKLSLREEKFVECYLKHSDAHRGAIEAGYSETRLNGTVKRLLSHDGVIEKIAGKIAGEIGGIADSEEILMFLTRIMRGEETEVKKTVVRGEEVEIEEEPSIQLRTKAAELLGKRLSLFSEKESGQGEEIEVNINVIE